MIEVTALAGEPLRRGDRVRLERGYAVAVATEEPCDGVVDPFGSSTKIVSYEPVKVLCRASTRIRAVGERGLVIDEGRNLVINRGVEHYLGGKRSLRDFVYYMARRVGQRVPKERILRDVWGLQGDYHPLRHDPNLHSHAKNARAVLGREAVNFYFDEGDPSAAGGSFAFEPPVDHFLHVALD